MTLLITDQSDIAPLLTIIILALIMIAALLLYVLPAFVAGFRRHPNTAAITLLTLFLGWTFIGWAIALIWSVSAIDDDRRYR